MKKVVKWIMVFLALACEPMVEPTQNMQIDGYTPVYGEAASAAIRLLPPQMVRNPGKIYEYGTYLLVNEVNRGIHIYNNENPANPVAIGFAELIGNSDMAIRNGILYADHMGSLVALNTNNFSELVELGRLPISNWLLGVPPPSQHYFECVDQSKGLVVGWKKKLLNNPDCYAF